MEGCDSGALLRVKSYVESWPFMNSLYPVLSVTMLYLVFVTILGPTLIKGRKQMTLSGTMMTYNIGQVIFSSWWLIKFFTNSNAIRYVTRSTLHSSSFKLDEVLEKQIDELGYYYLLSKYVEFLDTVFFILRHKWSQVTFLHVYHHTNMAISTWFYLKFIWGRHTIVIAAVNVFIHVLMYTYYLLSSLGPWIRPYLWWKRYITRLQMGQFVFLILYALFLILNGNRVQKIFTYYTIFNTSSFLVLFADFYRKAYTAGDRKMMRKHL